MMVKNLSTKQQAVVRCYAQYVHLVVNGFLLIVPILFLRSPSHCSLFGPVCVVYIQKKQSKGTKRTTRQAKALEARKAPRTFLELLHEVNKP